MADQVSCVGQAGAVMAGDAMEKDGPSRRVREQIRGLRHLFHSCARPVHRHDLPSYTGFSDNFRLIDVLGISSVNRRERHDCLDSFATNNPVQCRRSLPTSPYQLAGDDHADPLFVAIFPPRHGANGRSNRDHDSDHHPAANRDWMIHGRANPSGQQSVTAP
jgi:hypothetical protein